MKKALFEVRSAQIHSQSQIPCGSGLAREAMGQLALMLKVLPFSPASPQGGFAVA